VQELCQKPAGSVFLSTCLTRLMFGVPFALQLLLSARNLHTSS